jgi:hypothetical protein
VEAAREQVRVLTFEKLISIGLSNQFQRLFTSPSWMDKKVHRVNVKMSQEMKVFLRLLIITSLKKHSIFIVATLLKYRECREFHFAFYVIITLHYWSQKQRPHSSTYLQSHEPPTSFIETWDIACAWCVSFCCLYCKIKHNKVIK